MCGICGFTGALDGAADRATLKAMCDAMAHRGPDGEGRYIADGIALGHRRLSLIDLAGGGQPMVRATGGLEAGVSSPAVVFDHVRGEAAAHGDDARPPASCERGRWSIVFNGEIYNYRELRSELQEQGYVFTTGSDTEVLLVGFIAWSQAVLQRLRGMFAFAIYDAQTHELFCARDPFGIKPFYYALVNPSAARASSAGSPGAQFIFASEIKSILEHPAYTRELNEEALSQYLCFQFSALSETFFKGVFKLAQGHCLRVSRDGSVEIERYWRPEFRADGLRSAQETVDAVEGAVRDSVRFHNVADVEVGSFLSSGIDSSYLAACLARENPGIKTFTVGFAQYTGERDEVNWARELAGELGVKNDAHHVSAEEYWDAVPLVQWHMDEPAADPSAVALYFVDKIAARSVKAVLSGEGADELFGGYRIYQAPLANERVGAVPGGVLRMGSKALHALGLRGANYLDRASGGVGQWYYTNANGAAFTPEQRDRVLAQGVRQRLAAARRCPDVRRAIGLGARRVCAPGADEGLDGAGALRPQELAAPVYDEAASLDEPTRMQYVDLWFWLVGDILLKTDKMSMAHSLESRVPFLDREVFRVAAGIPTVQKVGRHQTKIALRQAAERSIPRGWAQKEKLGFPVPLAGWLRENRYYERVKREFESDEAARFFDVGELSAILDEHRSGNADHSRRIWIVYSFLVWYRIYFVERRSPATGR